MLFSQVYCTPSKFRQTETSNNASSMSYSFKVKFSREPPNDFYVSGDRVQGIIQVISSDEEKALVCKYGPLQVEFIGELNGFITDSHGILRTKNMEKFFRITAHVHKLPDENQHGVRYLWKENLPNFVYALKKSPYYVYCTFFFLKKMQVLRSYKWTFDGQLDPYLPSSLPPDDRCDPCIFYYARVYFQHYPDMARIFAFIVFTRKPTVIVPPNSFQSENVERSIEYKGVKLHGLLPNNGLAVPGQSLMLQIEVENPMEMRIKLIRATLKQYRNIINEQTDFTIFSFNLPGFQSKKFTNKYRLSTYELPIPLTKCRLMAPTSVIKNVRYELQIQCHLYCLFNNHFTLNIPVICTTNHQQPLNIMKEFKSLTELLQHQKNSNEEKSPPTYEDFVASELLPKYDEISH